MSLALSVSLSSSRRGRGLLIFAGDFSLLALIIHSRLPLLHSFGSCHSSSRVSSRGLKRVADVTNDSFDAQPSTMGEILSDPSPRILGGFVEDEEL